VFQKLKTFTIRMIGGANFVTVIIMLLTGFSDRLNPADHPLLSTTGMAFPFFVLATLAFLFFWLVFKWRMMWISVLGLLCAYVPISIYMPINAPQDLPEDGLKLVSYNVCAYSGNGRYDDGFRKVVEYLVKESPDIVCLQEDIDTWRSYVFSEYQKHWAFNDTVVIASNALSLNAVGIHTRFPIVKRERIDYPSVGNGSVAWWLKVGGDTLIVVNNHLESCHLSSDDRQQYRHIIKGEMPSDSLSAESKTLLIKLAEANAKRSGQVRAVMQYVASHSQYPIIVCGDFNDNPISYSCHSAAECLTDCFRTTGRGLGLSYNQKAFSFRIDHIFCSSRLKPYNCKVDSKMDASDHYPILCWLKLDGK